MSDRSTISINIKDLIGQTGEELKKTSKDFALVVQAMVNYRQAVLNLHEQGTKLVTELKRIVEQNPTQSYCTSSYQDLLTD